MKKIIYNRIFFLQFFCIVAVFALLFSCEKDEVDPPVISEIRNYDASPNDTIINSLNAGQWVVVLGKNFSGVKQVYFGSIAATINSTLLTNESIVVQVPEIPFKSVPREKLNIVTVVNSSGPASFEIVITGAPIISYVRNNTGNDNTIVESIVPNQQINIVGYNLKNATRIAFQGIEVDLASVVFTDSSALVKVPSELSGGDASLANTIGVTNKVGTGTFSIRIIGPPIITNISYEIPKEGNEVIISGNNFFSIKSLTFAGTTISDFVASGDGSSIKFKAPKLTQSGPVVVTNGAGTFTTAYNVNDVKTGALSNFEWDGAFKWDWWGGASLTVDDPSLNEGWIPVAPEFKGNGSKFLAMDLPVQHAGDGAEWNTAIRATGGNAMAWFPSVANLNDPASSWALKFEIYVAQDWNGGTLVIKTTNSDYVVRYEPWQVSQSKTAPYKTSGWQTVTIPLSAFRKNDGTLGDGKGVPITTIKELFNKGSVTGDLLLYVHNYGTADTSKFKGAFDNFRVVKR